jgi:Nucleoside-diphosphate-sugar epimerases
MHILVTGAAGFIGFHFARRLLRQGHTVVGFDNLNSYYDVSLKEARLEALQREQNAGKFTFLQGDLANTRELAAAFAVQPVTQVINLAAQAGVRYSLENPQVYVQSNLVGFANVLECCRAQRIEHLIYASSSSVYGLNGTPFSTSDNVDHPVSLYAATKKSNELMAHTYSHLYGLPTTGLRFFTVYGPWGRPDMALFLFTKSILEGRPIKVFSHGKLRRDFTYVDDIVEAMERLLTHIPQKNSDWDSIRPDPSSSSAPWKVYNIGNNNPVELETFIATLEEALGKKAIREMLPMQPGDVEATWADVDDLIRDIDFAPTTPLKDGISAFVQWYQEYTR